jgi:UDP-N-acetylglucosamine 2-epimerase (non-hydrolysing)
MKKLKVMTIVGTRPELIRLSEVIRLCDQYFEHLLVHTGQNYDYELNQIFFDELEIRKPDYYLGVAEQNLGQTIGKIISESYRVMDEVKPDAVLILGDTNSALSAIPAKRLKIPIFHMEAGNRSFDQNLPEEINRTIVDHIADINLPYTEHARRYLLSEGVKKEHIFVTGSPMREVLVKHQDKIAHSQILSELQLKKGQYLLVSAHREENIDNEKSFFSLMEAINVVAEHYQLPIIYSTHPRSKNQIEKRNFQFHPLVKSLAPFGFFDYCSLQKNALCVLSDSGTLAEECSILDFPAVSIRTSTERPEAIDEGNMIIGGIDQESILQATKLAIEMTKNGILSNEVTDYADKKVAKKIIKIIQSYTQIVNKMVWRK